MELLSHAAAVGSKLETKDWITLAASFSALVVSSLSYLQRSKEGKLALRKQMTDLFEKLSAFNLESEKAQLRKNDYPAGFAGLLNDQRRFVTQQITFLLEKVADLVNPYEYLLLGRAYDDLDDPYLAELYFEQAIKSATSQTDRGVAMRRYAQYLFGHGPERVAEGRLFFEKALAAFTFRGDRSIISLSETYLRWSKVEALWENHLAASELQEKARKILEKLENPYRRKQALAQYPRADDNKDEVGAG